MPSPVWQLCDRSLSLPAHRDRVAAQWTNPEDYRSRQLVTFSDADAAHALVAELSAFYGSCPQQPTGFDYIGYQHAVSRPLGDEAAALYRVQEYQGAPGLGVDIMQVVRVGRAVLLDSVSNEGDARGVRGQLRRMTRASAPVVSGLCAWSDDGCPPPRGSITLGPDGVGAIRLGMSARAVRALGIRLHPAHNGTGCSSFIWRVEGHVVQGDLDPRIGVSMLIGDRLATPEGIGPGAPAWRAEAAYADGGHDAQLFVPSVPGRPDRSYRMELRRGSVASLRLLADDQHCAS